MGHTPCPHTQHHVSLGWGVYEPDSLAWVATLIVTPYSTTVPALINPSTSATNQTRPSIHVTDLNECILNCDLFATFGQCDCLVYFNHGPDENCHLHAQGESMEEYLHTCNTVGQPTRYQDGHCMTDYAPVCKVGLFCNEGCTPCDKFDKCNKYQTDCTLKGEYVSATELDDITMDGCTGACIAQSMSNPSTYFTWDKAAEACKCYNGGARECVKEVVMAGFSHADVVSCRT